jgi:hypothetical protein
MWTLPRIRRLGLSAAMALAAATSAWGQGAKQSSVTDADIAALKPGQFIWAPQAAPAGPMVMVVSLTTQRASVYRNGVRIAVSTVSTGKKGHATPTGVFTILQKNKDHRSNLYNNAPMPYMQRLTWDGIALHAGNLPGKPASHGCIRLPMAFARDLFGETDKGMTVVITKGNPSPTDLDEGDLLAPVTAAGAALTADPAEKRLAAGEAFRWTPERAPAGPVTLLASSLDQRLLVLRNGKIIGRGRISLPGGELAGDHALAFKGFDAKGHSQWIYIGVPGDESRQGQRLDIAGLKGLRIPPAYLKLVRSVLTPGVTLMVTDGGIAAGGAGKPVSLLESDAG